MKAKRRQRLLRRLVLGLAVAAFAAPAAQAETWYLEGALNASKPASAVVNQRQVETLAFHEGRGVQTSTQLNHRQIEQALANARHPVIPSESRHALEAAGSPKVIPYLSQGSFEAPGTLSVDRKADLVTPSDLPASLIVETDGGFSWSDAGIGAGTVLALLLLAAGGAGAARFRRGPQAA